MCGQAGKLESAGQDTGVLCGMVLPVASDTVSELSG